MYLYAVQMNIFGYPFQPIKIGVSRDPQLRSKAYTSGPFPTAWLGAWRDDDAYASERKIHARFRDYRLAGEWFYPTTSLVAYIQEHLAVPIGITLTSPPTKQKTQFEMRFVRLFPNGIASIENEWKRPGLAQPCDESAFLEAWAALDAIEAGIEYH